MLHIFEGGGRLAEDAVLAAMFEARKRVFVDLLGWDVPVLAGRFEVDQFDDVHARYLVLTDRQGSHLGSARLLRSEEHTSELQSLMRISYAVFCFKKKTCKCNLT